MTKKQMQDAIAKKKAVPTPHAVPPRPPKPPKIAVSASPQPPDAPKPKKWYSTRPSRLPAARDARMLAKGRLPDRSGFAASYDAATNTWKGCLDITDKPGQSLQFSHSASGVFRLLSELDDMYREHLRKQDAAIPEG